MVRKNYFSAMILLITLLLSGILYPQSVKAQNKSRIYGTVYELDGKNLYHWILLRCLSPTSV